MKWLVSLIFSFIIIDNCFSQTITTDTVHPLFTGKMDGDKIREEFDYIENTSSVNRNPGPKDEITLAIFHSRNLYPITVLNNKEKIKEVDGFAKDYSEGSVYSFIRGALRTPIVPLFDSASIVVTAYGITKETQHDFEFRVLLNKTKVLKPWTGIKFFSTAYMHFHYSGEGKEYKEMAYIGSFNAPMGNSITIEARNKKEPNKTSMVTAVWINRSPRVIATFVSGQMRDFFETYKYQWKYDFQQPDRSYYGDIKTRSIDSLLHLQTKFSSSNEDLFFYLGGKVKSAEKVEYNIIKDVKDSTGWQTNDFDPNIIWLKNLSPGKYKLQLRYSFQRQTISNFSFQVLPAWYQTSRFYLIVGGIFALVAGFIMLLIKSILQKRRLKKEETQKQIVQTEIKSIKSQFNPHFVFNSLNSIQGLITKQDFDAAHKYLVDFSSLLRNSLKESEKEFVSLSKDIELIDNYLKLEQLRFGFNYRIEVNATINREEIEFPVLLLQPAIENAIKHGISGLYERGLLLVSYSVNQNDIVVTILDNGKGYDKKTVAAGYGLKLTDERVVLINKLLNGQKIVWEIANTGSGTKVLFIFKNWLI